MQYFIIFVLLTIALFSCQEVSTIAIEDGNKLVYANLADVDSRMILRNEIVAPFIPIICQNQLELKMSMYEPQVDGVAVVMKKSIFFSFKTRE